MSGTAYFSPCGKFRYTLTREWEAGKERVAFLLLNPSTATAERDDPTIRRCIGFAKKWGYGALLILNLYAYRATKPAAMWAAQSRGVDVIGGKENWVDSLKSYADQFQVERVIAAWGGHGTARGKMVAAQWPGLMCLGLNADGSPCHPLYLKGSLEPFLLNWKIL